MLTSIKNRLTTAGTQLFFLALLLTVHRAVESFTTGTGVIYLLRASPGLALDLSALVGLWLLLACLPQLLRRLVMLPLYLFVITELAFHQVTGMYFSAELAEHAFRLRKEMQPVIASAALDLPVLAGVALGLVVFVATAIPRISRRIEPSAPAFALLIGVLIVVFGVCANQPSPSLFATFALSNVSPPVDIGTPVDYDYDTPRLSGKKNNAPAPDVLLVILESARAAAIPGFGGIGPKAVMPTIERLIPESRLYLRAYTTTPHTSKALVGIICGAHPRPNLKILEATPGGLPLPCLPNLLAGAGYRSLFMTTARRDFENRIQLTRNMGFELTLTREDIAQGYLKSGYFGVDEVALVQPLLDWWGNGDKKPRFATILTSMSHHPYQPIDQLKPKWRAPKEEQLANYIKTLAYTDYALGLLLDGLKSKGFLDNTIVIVTGDHGEAFGEHQLYVHDRVSFDEVIRVPLLVFDGRKKIDGGKDQMLRQHTDILPTVLNLSGATFLGHPAGRDLLTDGHKDIVTSCWPVDFCFALVDASQRKWIYSPLTGRLEVYQLDSDPEERINLADSIAADERAAAVKRIWQHQISIQQFYAGR